MFCPKCGSDVADHAKFCPKCGATISSSGGGAPDGAAPASPAGLAGQTAQVRAETPAATAVADKPEKKGKNKALLAAIPIVAVLAAAVLFLMPKTDSQDDIDPVLNQDANTQLLALIDQAEERHEKAKDEFTAINDSQSEGETTSEIVERYNALGQIYTDFLTDLAALQEEANAIDGLDSKMKSARDEYFSMLHDARAAHIEVLAFEEDYLAFWGDVVAWRPLEVDYDDLEAYAQELSSWTQTCKEGYAAIPYPSCVESEWKQYAEILEYNESISQKLNTAIQYDDWLRYYSTVYMSDRYNTIEENLYDKMMDCIRSEFDFVGTQLRYASALAGEMHAYAELDPEARETYEFENDRSGEITLSYETADTIYPSLYNTYDAFAILKTGCISGTRSIVIEAEIDGFTQKFVQSYDLDSSYRAIYIKPPALTGSLNLSSAKDAQLRITVSDKDGTLIDAKTFPVTIKSKYDFKWYTDEYGYSTQDNILCFLTPEATAVRDLKRTAIDEMAAISGGRVEAFGGYQSITPVEYATTYLQSVGLMSALYKMGIRYDMAPFSISGSDQQRVKLPEDVIAERSGLCIETSLAIASALQSANMHAFVILPPGHAQVAVEFWNRGEWKGQYFLIETTALDAASNDLEMYRYNFQNMLEGYVPNDYSPVTYLTIEEWRDYLANEVEYVIDCDDSLLLGLTPFTN